MPKNTPPNQNQTSNPSQPKQTPQQPANPQQNAKNESNSKQSDNSAINLKFILFSAGAFLLVIGAAILTVFLYTQDSQEPNLANESEQTESISNQAQANGNFIPNEDVVCARFTDLENALEVPEKACVLDLSNQNLNSIPTEIYELNNLTNLNLSNNNLSEFPNQLLEISSLIEINLSNNNISTISAGIQMPENLKVLNLSGNNLNNEVMQNYHRVFNSSVSSQ